MALTAQGSRVDGERLALTSEGMSEPEEVTFEVSSKAFRGAGWVFERIGDDYAVHREGVSPSSADAGEVLYVSVDELFAFAAVTDLAGAALLSPEVAMAMFGNCPIEFVENSNDAVLFSTVGIPPERNARVNLPGRQESGLVANVVWTYGTNGARSARVYLR